MDVIAILEGKGIDYVVKGSGEISIHCPNAINHQDGSDSIESFNINVDRIESHCFACGLSMNTAKLTKWLLGEDLDEQEYKCLELRGKLNKLHNTVSVAVSVPTKSNFVLPPGEPWTEDYRGIKAETYKKLLMYKCTRGKYENRIVAPIMINNKLVGFDARALANDMKPKYHRPPGVNCKEWLYPFDLAREYKIKRVVACEGLFHGINYFDKIGIPEAQVIFGVNNWSQHKLLLLLGLGIEEFIYFADRDSAGEKAIEEICSQVCGWIPTYVADTSHLKLDPLATLSKGKQVFQDLGDISREEIEIALKRKVKFTG